MDLLYILLGAALAVAGGLIGQRQAEILLERRADHEILLQLHDATLELSTHVAVPTTPIARAPSPHPALAPLMEHLADADARLAATTTAVDIGTSAERLTSLALRLRCDDHRTIAVRATKLGLDPEFRIPANFDALLDALELAINPKMVAQYNAEDRKPHRVF